MSLDKIAEKAKGIDSATDSKVKRALDWIISSRFTAFILGGVAVTLIMLGARLC